MISDSLDMHERYLNAAPGLGKAFAWLSKNAKDPPGDGKYEIGGERVFAIVVTYTTAPRSEKILEGHQRYIDLQYLAAGGPEAIPFVPAGRAPITEDYDPTADLVKYDPEAAKSEIVLEQGDFAIFFPEDAHMPGVAHAEPVEVKKIVVKVRV
ncbi:MAG: YhcH/YjgK/YiaL family protein [Gemmatimonadota bacterium]|nr:YhcH/YjgK/YiaL family protein [Gemmatimonadota bacterium]